MSIIDTFEFDIHQYDIIDLLHLLHLHENPDRDIEYVIISLSKVSIQEAIDEKTVRLYELDDITDQEIDKIKLFFERVKETLLKEKQKLEYEQRRRHLESKKAPIHTTDTTFHGPALPRTTNYTPNDITKEGGINSIYTKTLTKMISIDTLFRKRYRNTLSTDFTHQFTDPIKNVVSLKLSSFEIPNIWRAFSSKDGTNRFSITVRNFYNDISFSNIVPEQTYEIVIPEGNYSPCEFITTVNKFFFNHDPDNTNQFTPDKITGLNYLQFKLNELTGQTILTTIFPDEFVHNTSRHPYDYTKLPENFEYTIDFTNPKRSEPYLHTGWFLGFRKTKYTVKKADYLITNYADEEMPIDFTIINRPASLVSEGIYGSKFNNYIYLCVDDYNNNRYHSVITNGVYHHDSILARVMVTTEYNTIVYNSSQDLIYKKREYFGPVTLDKIRITLRDKYGEILEIGENDFSFALEVDVLYA